jgi:hypothetical protein
MRHIDDTLSRAREHVRDGYSVLAVRPDGIVVARLERFGRVQVRHVTTNTVEDKVGS